MPKEKERSKSFNKSIVGNMSNRKLVSVSSSVLHWASGILFVIYSVAEILLVKKSAPDFFARCSITEIGALWILLVIALIELIAKCLDRISGIWDAEELKELRSQVDSTQATAETAILRSDGRTLGQTQKAILKATADKFPSQKFIVICDRGNAEGCAFGLAIHDFLTNECRWNAIPVSNPSDNGKIQLTGQGQDGIGVGFLPYSATVQQDVPARNSIANAFREAKIVTFEPKYQSDMTLLYSPGSMGIIIGAKPISD